MLAGAGTAPAAARVREPGVVAPSPAPMNLPAGPMAMGQPETSAASGPSSESALRVSSDSATPPARTWFPLEGLYPPDSPIASSFVKNGPAGAVAVLETVKPSVPVEGPDLRIGTGRAARAAAGRNGAGPVFQQAGITSYDITLKPGSNLISLPLMPDDTAIEAVLAGILDRVETVWQYDTSGPDPKWRSYAPGAPSDLRVMRDGPGYWVHLKEDGTGDEALTITGGDASGPARRVVQGWNLVGFTATTAGDAATDRAALVALYNATDGANWLNNGNWLSNAPMGVWDGVTTDSDGRVTHLDLRYNQLTGEIPAELGSLTNLERLNLRHNQLTGEIPAELGSLTNLERLNLRHNQLTGEIPAELGSLTNLERLDLNANQLTGEIPAELGSLTNLEGLSLYNNQLTGEIPAELGSLANLRVLSLYSNQLTGEIPAELGGLTNLIALYLLFNQLTGCIPEGLRNVANNDLAQLGLDYCMPAASASDAATDRAALAALYNATDGANWLNNGNWLSNAPMREWHGVTTDSDGRVTRLLLSNNQLTGEISAELGSLTNLEWLRLTSNQLTGEIPAELGSLTNLRALWLGGNQLTGEIPEELGSLTNLKYLDLSFNQLTGGIPAELGDLTHLEGLWLNGNQLTGEIPEELGSLTYLKNLYLPLNQLSGEIPSALADLSNLEALILTGNQLTGCIPNGLRGIETNDLSRLGLPFCDMPGAPTIATPIVPGDASLTVAWAAPINTGSSAITAYDLRYIETGAADKSDANWTVVEDVWAAGSGSLQYTLNGLTGGTQYAVQVRAVTADGDGPWSSSAIGTPATWGAIRSFSPPSAALGGEVVVTVTASGYGPFGGIMETLPAGFRYVSSSLPDDSVTVNGQEVTFSLLGETDFTYTVAAPSAEGSYSFSGVLTNSDRAEVPVGGAITIAVAAGAPLIVRYDANGNGMIEKNEVIAAINDYLFGEGDAAISKSDVIKLINLYLFAPSTPHNRPGAPEGLTAAGNGQTRIDLSWRAPASDGGAAITGYRIEVSENGSTWNDLVADTRNAATSYSHTGLTAGSTRHYRVSAINSAGTGPASSVATALPPATDGCFQSVGALTAAVTRNGTWTGDCASTHQSGRYARFYSFTLNQQTEVEINLTSAQDTYLYLLRGADANGTVVTDNDDIESGNTNSRITRTLSAGTYTIEATTYSEGVTGDFTLSIVPTGVTAPLPADACEYVLTAGAATAPPGGAISGQWTGDCASTNQAGSYARYYIFTLASDSDMTITLESSVDTFLYLLEGAGTGGTVIAKNDDVATGNTNSQIREFLSAGTYTIEATTHKEAITGEFTLTVTGISIIVSVPASGDRDALVEFYHATGGSNWRNTDNWLSNSPLGQWYGVTTDSSDRVIELELSFNGLIGQLPAQLGNLSGLTRLDLSGNQLSGEIPAELGNLSHLEDLNLWSNQLSGDIPARLGNLSGLTHLDLSDNQLSGQIPFELGNLVSLRGLTLNSNQLSGEIPAELGSLTNLIDLLLGGNQLSGQIPFELGNLSNLDWLLLAGNQLTGCIPEGLRNVERNDFDALGLSFCGDGSPDLIVQSPSASNNNPDTGEVFTFYAQVHNQGDGASASTTLRYYRSDNDTISTSDTEVGSNDIVALGPSETWPPPSIGVNAPSLAGTYYYGACVDPVPGESNTQNNCSAAATVIADSTSPDLIVQSPSASNNNPDTGEVFTFYAQVHNQGDGASASTTLRYYRSDNDTISTSDTEVGSNDIVALGPSETWPPPSIGVNAPSLAGTYYYGACVDPVPGESNTRNNCSRARTIVVIDDSGPDLIVSEVYINPTSPLSPGQSFDIYAKVENIGDARAASSPLNYFITRSRTGSISGSDIIGRDTVSSLGASEYEWESHDSNAPSTPGTYYYGACVNSVPGESNPNNNCSARYPLVVNQPPKPDLTAEVVSIGDDNDQYVDETFTFTARVRNIGNASASSSTLRFYRSTNSYISAGDTQLTTRVTRLLSSSGTRIVSASDLTAPSDTRTYYYGVCVDSVSGESNTGNNCSAGRSVTVGLPYSLSNLGCTSTGFFNIRAKFFGTFSAFTALDDVKVIGYVRSGFFGLRVKIGEDDLGDLSSGSSASFEIEGGLGSAVINQQCQYEVEWDYP